MQIAQISSRNFLIRDKPQWRQLIWFSSRIIAQKTLKDAVGACGCGQLIALFFLCLQPLFHGPRGFADGVILKVNLKGHRLHLAGLVSLGFEVIMEGIAHALAQYLHGFGLFADLLCLQATRLFELWNGQAA
jgi:hypothetical protein